MLANHRVWHVADLHAAAVENRLDLLARDWLAVTGQGSGISGVTSPFSPARISTSARPQSSLTATRTWLSG
ncbi:MULTISPECIES: hypothetical protein [Mycobacterium simiae complex]|uniref:Uncharacterized protein n=1 Tax=Mycobacterium lentiflavum TaxID=141349 RepID=A0ABY3V8K2_MYCLN|nr:MULTISPECIES: hypothetical protein [Mycobacterium simiae complex]ULP45526.1 hypothetical protein MJO58_27670 [Mycobacterium lentiflavum]